MLARTAIFLSAFALLAPSALASDGPTPRTALKRSAAALEGRAPAGDGREVSPLLKDLAVAIPHLRGHRLARAKRLLARPTQGDAVRNESSYSVAEHNPPFCSVHFCIHWVDSTVDAPPLTDQNANGVPDYVETMSGVFEHVFDVENGQLGWRAPKPDGTRGCPGGAPSCQNKTDVYIKDVGGRGVYGYTAPDPDQTTNSQHAYLVMDDDYSAVQFERYGGDSLPPMEVTAAHEYNHVLQYGYDVAQDTWMFESTATWMEDKVYTEVNDYLQYIDAWAKLTEVPLTQFDSSSDTALNAKAYGAAVWNRWLDKKFGPDVIRNAWERSLRTHPASFAPGAYDSALRARGSSFTAAFAQFTADTAEWRSANSQFDEGSTFTDIERASDGSGRLLELRPGRLGVAGALNHTAYALLDVPPLALPRLKLVFQLERRAHGALALVGRTGDIVGGDSTTVVRDLRKGGTGVVELDDTGRFNRITAVVMNSDISLPFRDSRAFCGEESLDAGRCNPSQYGDWTWKRDRQSIVARASTDFKPPRVRAVAPRNGSHDVSRRARFRATFSERMSGVAKSSVALTAHGRRVRARVKLRSRGRKLYVIPRGRLRARTLYTVKLSSSVRDLGGNVLPRSSRKWRFRTGR